MGDHSFSNLRDTGELFLQGSGDRRMYHRVCCAARHAVEARKGPGVVPGPVRAVDR